MDLIKRASNTLVGIAVLYYIVQDLILKSKSLPLPMFCCKSGMGSKLFLCNVAWRTLINKSYKLGFKILETVLVK